jgi:hypothetical protein
MRLAFRSSSNAFMARFLLSLNSDIIPSLTIKMKMFFDGFSNSYGGKGRNREIY